MIVFGVNFDGGKTGDELVMSILEKGKKKDKTRSIEYKTVSEGHASRSMRRFKIYWMIHPSDKIMEHLSLVGSCGCMDV